MRYLRYLALLSVCLFAASYSNAQLRVGVGVGVGPVGGYYGGAPVCSYGYYGYAPYACAPYGYYGSEDVYKRQIRINAHQEAPVTPRSAC